MTLDLALLPSDIFSFSFVISIPPKGIIPRASSCRHVPHQGLASDGNILLIKCKWAEALHQFEKLAIQNLTVSVSVFDALLH